MTEKRSVREIVGWANLDEMVDKVQPLLDTLEFYARADGMTYPKLELSRLEDVYKIPEMVLLIATKPAKEALENFYKENES